MGDHLVRKLEHHLALTEEEKQALRALARSNVRSHAPREDIVREGDRPTHVNIMLEGYACRYKMLDDGRRQIVSLFLPGDVCDARVFILKAMDHTISTLSNVKVASIPAEQFIKATDCYPGLIRAFWWNTLVEEAIAREWIVNLGQRTAAERMAHMMCEIYVRMCAVGLADGETCDLPLTQAEIGEVLGLSAVHTNRTLQALRQQGLLSVRERTLSIPDLDRLMAVGMFSSNYLHLDRIVGAADAVVQG